MTDWENKELSSFLYESPKTEKKFRRCCEKHREAFGPSPHFLGSLYEKKEVPLLVKKVDEEVGLGLFSVSQIEKGDPIVPYLGVVRKKRFFWKETEYSLRFPFFSFFSPFFVDSKEWGSKARFINHSENPNGEFVLAWQQGVFVPFIRSLRHIHQKEQITIHYGKDYWRNRKPPKQL